MARSLWFFDHKPSRHIEKHYVESYGTPPISETRGVFRSKATCLACLVELSLVQRCTLYGIARHYSQSRTFSSPCEIQIRLSDLETFVVRLSDNIVSVNIRLTLGP